MRRAFNILILSIVLLPFHIYAQPNRSYETNPDRKRTNIWHFGQNAGINFNTKPPTALTNGKVNTIEGCASICDTAGNLLFYTDGKTIWNKNNDTIIGGIGINMQPSATQGAIIIPHPGNDSLFYLFTIGKFGGFDSSYLSLINIKSNKIVYKNKYLFPGETTEKLSAVKHRNKRWYWVSFKAVQDSFYNFLVTENGIIETPYITKSIITETMIGGGAMKFSPDGSKLAICDFFYLPNNQDVELCKFNNESGTLSNNQLITNISKPYGIDFSTNGKRLYVAEASKKLVQFDISSTNISAINASRNVLADISKYSQIEGLQLAPNENIYMAGHDSFYMGSITNINSLSPIFNARGLHLGGKRSEYGTPAFVQSYFHTLSVDFVYYYNCVNNSVAFEGKDTFNASSHNWSITKVYGSSTPQTSTSKNHIINFLDTGLYQIEYIVGNGSRNDTVIKQITIIPKVNNHFLGKDTGFCYKKPFSLTLAAPSGMHDYLWSNSSNQRSIVVNDTGIYSVIVTVKSLCQVTDTITVFSISNPIKPSITRVGDTLFTSATATKYEWFKDGQLLPLSDKSKIILIAKGKYTLRVTNQYGCTSISDTFIVDRLSDISSIPFNRLIIFPNPFSSEISIENIDSQNQYTISISDPSGKVLKSLIVQRTANVTVPLSHLANGVYIIQITDNQHNTTIRKLIKQ